MPKLVMMSWTLQTLVALLIAGAAVFGSCRPVDHESRLVSIPVVPELRLARCFPPLVDTSWHESKGTA